MGYTERLELYKEVESIRNRPLLVYVTSIRPNGAAEMSADALPVIIEQVESLYKTSENIDLLIVSNSGDPIVSLRIISILRERFKSIGVLVPYVAFSAATILALGADEIVMHPYSNLGPVDPQLTVTRQTPAGQASNMQFSSEDIRNYIEFIRKDVGITDQAELISAFNSLASEVGSVPIGYSRRSQQLSLSLSEKMLGTHMEDKSRAATIAQTLNTSYYHHGYAVNRAEASEIGLNVVNPDEKLEQLLWDIWMDFSQEMKCAEPLDVLAEVLSDPDARAQLFNVPSVTIPVGLPPELIPAVLQSVQIPLRQTKPIESDTLIASIESCKSCSSLRIHLSTICWREANMNITYNTTQSSEGWQCQDMKPKA